MKSRLIAMLGLGAVLLSAPTGSRAEGPDIQAILSPTPGYSSQTELRAFYEARAFQPAWKDSDRKVALAFLMNAENEGLAPDNYVPRGAISSATSDIALTRAVLFYAKDVRVGRLAANSVYNDADLPPQPFDAGSMLGAALNKGELKQFLADLPPQQDGYAFLRTALAKYRQVNAEGGWRPLRQMKGAVDVLQPAERAELRERLAAEDRTIEDNNGDANLDAALRRFQFRNGLEADGKIGPHTLKALNITASARVLQIEANMERWRWLPHRLEPRYIMVNTADASLEAIDNGKVVLASRIVAGKPKTPTPIFAATIVAVTVNPPWNVPQSIARKEILPKLRRNPSYLAKEHMILRNGPAGDSRGVTINWASISRSGFPFQIQQLPGKTNALGQLKLEMPNRFDVYMHDTPAKTLFTQNERFFSHGCVRVQKVGALAKYALTGNPQADVARLIAEDDTTDRLPLNNPLKVYVLYWTVFQDTDGNIAFRDDIYDRDQRLIAALSGKRVAERPTPPIECNA